MQEEYSNFILEAYVEELIKDKQYTLIAYYISKLPADAQVHWYAKFLEGKHLVLFSYAVVLCFHPHVSFLCPFCYWEKLATFVNMYSIHLQFLCNLILSVSHTPFFLWVCLLVQIKYSHWKHIADASLLALQMS